MSRFLKVMIVLLTIAAMATPVLAEQRLTLNGEMRVRGWYVDYDLDHDGDGSKDTNTWADQRLRFAGKMSVAEGVSVTFRFDATESNWGSQPGFGSGRFVTNGTMHWDRAHLDIEKGMIALRAGQFYTALGQSGFDAQDNGLQLTVKGQVPVTVFFMVDNENASGGKVNLDTGATGNVDSDAYYYGLNVGHKTDVYAANVFAAGQKNSATGNEVYVLGVNYAQTIDALKIFAEIDYFTGDATPTDDAYGLQLFADVSAAVSETVRVGGQIFYAMGDDEDVQYSVLGNDFGGWDPIFALGTGLDNEQIKGGVLAGGRPFDILGNGAGIYAARVYGSFKVSNDLSLAASLFYGVKDEDDMAVFEDVIAVGAGLKYNVMANTNIGVQAQYSEYSSNITGLDDLEKLEAGMGLFVNF